MPLLKNHAYIYGFEDYNIITLGDGCFLNTYGFHIPYSFDNSTGAFIINKNLPVKALRNDNKLYSWWSEVEFEPVLAEDHKQLLSVAKKVFVHPSCNLSRSLMAEKYKKSLNPYLSDAVIIPNPNYDNFSIDKVALFINEQAKLIVKVKISDDKAENVVQTAEEGTVFRTLITCEPDDSYGTYKGYTTGNMLDSKLFYYGELLYIPNSQSWAMGVLTHSIPMDKIVFESSVQESLSNETNQLDFDSLCSIKDMLESSDENTVSAGLKSLSMMDWMHYPQSVKYILKSIKDKYNWIYNKACNSTSVKYMMNTISSDVRRKAWWPGEYDYDIYEADFELFKKLKCHYENILPENIISSIKFCNFIKVTPEGLIVPNIKQVV